MSYVPKAKKRKVASPQSVLVVDSSQIKIFSVKLNYRESRTFVVKSSENELSAITRSARIGGPSTWPVI